MNEKFIAIFKHLVDYIDIAFAEVSIIFFILGMVFLLLGFVIIALTVHTLVTGQRINGRVIGAVKDIKIKEKIRDGKINKERKEYLHAIYEYTQLDGSTHQKKSSNGGDRILKYKTGQKVKLIICPRKGYIDIYDAEDSSAPIMASIFIIVGFGITYQAANIYASLGVSTISLLGVIASLVFRILKGNNRNPKKDGIIDRTNNFESKDIRPIEEFIEEADNLS